MKKPRKPKFVPRLTEEDIKDVVSVLNDWTDKLTWEYLIEELLQRWHRTYTRQALDRHASIKNAYTTAKLRLRKSPVNLKRQGPRELVLERERRERAETKNKELERQIDYLDTKFLCWAYNALLRGLTEADLNRPLNSVDREPTR